MKIKVEGRRERRFNNVYNWILHCLRCTPIMLKIELRFMWLGKIKMNTGKSRGRDETFSHCL